MEPKFVQLEVYAVCEALVDELRAEVRKWSAFDRWSIGIQAVRAADSIGANIAEAEGHWGLRDRVRLLLIARGSALELQHWLRRAAAAGLAMPDNSKDRAAKASAMLNRLIAAVRARS